MAKVPAVLPNIEVHIKTIRNQRVMLDEELAKLYGVPTKSLVQAVKRNADRFPNDFMFQLTNQEVASHRSQIVTGPAQPTDYKQKSRRGTLPYAFTEQGVAMLSSVLNSPRAVAVNVEIMRTFVRIRGLAATHSELAKRLAELEQKTDSLAMKHDAFSKDTRQHLKEVFFALRELMTPPPTPAKQPMGFILPKKNGATSKRKMLRKQ